MIGDLRPYAEYKDSGLPWLGQVPGHWSTEPTTWLFRKMDRPVHAGDELVTCFRDGIVTFRRDRRLQSGTRAIRHQLRRGRSHPSPDPGRDRSPGGPGSALPQCQSQNAEHCRDRTRRRAESRGGSPVSGSEGILQAAQGKPAASKLCAGDYREADHSGDGTKRTELDISKYPIARAHGNSSRDISRRTQINDRF